MALETAKRRRKRLSMTSLIDVIFLLLLFFMLTSTFSRYSEVELTGGAPSAPSQAERVTRFVKLDGDRLLVDGQDTAFEAIAERLATNTEQMLVLAFSDRTSSQQLIDVLAVLRPLPKTQTMVLN
ncbi:Biopolymer transport protein ExbD/TolR [Falsiruegeria litorea R37]|uniref:Biopolymer transport protein ExbD/TolR n=1 Tax=Falsiruegeria litorea R37 TaxID=1200284 RepID=A0A1Y5SRL5_9RHOB|nr:biopolymer transporter ExbD [Falsiruegeria litorea]SLN46379.1 Biopolymer transport protein ExbD/TolR [Falsiruegeria litorea R37]